MARKSLPNNISRQLWAQCGGYCQRPDCNKWLFASPDEGYVSLANIAHIIGHGRNGPRSDHELADFIEKDGLRNLIMLCLECHKIVDELEKKYSVETMQGWKTQHQHRISSLFSITQFSQERDLLITVNDLLDANATIFKEYGPYSSNVINGESGDGLVIWRRRCLDTILPNNQKIIQIIERNKGNYGYPWDLYRQMLLYKLHVDAFQDNCILDQKVNDYKLFPIEFDHFVKINLGLKLPPLEQREDQELEFRSGQIHKFITRFLSDHAMIINKEELNRATMLIELRDGRHLKVFVTNTYYFTEYTFEKVIAIDPRINAIICSCPVATYSNPAKQLCIENGIGLFMIGEFMGAIWKNGEDYLNYLLPRERQSRLESIKRVIISSHPDLGLNVYAFGSYLRRKIYGDIDLMLVYSNNDVKSIIPKFENDLRTNFEKLGESVDITVTSSAEFSLLKLKYDNLTQI